jgi:hypothetical protein
MKNEVETTSKLAKAKEWREMNRMETLGRIARIQAEASVGEN